MQRSYQNTGPEIPYTERSVRVGLNISDHLVWVKFNACVLVLGERLPEDDNLLLCLAKREDVVNVVDDVVVCEKACVYSRLKSAITISEGGRAFKALA